MDLFFSFDLSRRKFRRCDLTDVEISYLDKKKIKKPSPHADNEDWEQNLIPFEVTHPVLKDKILTILPMSQLDSIKIIYAYSLKLILTFK